jgi:hypothetical protein
MAAGLQYRGGAIASRLAGVSVRVLHIRFVIGLVVAVVVGLAAGLPLTQAVERDETVLTVVVSSAEHEAYEGYFSLGDSATVMTKPGSDLHKFLSRHRGKKVRIVLSDAGRPGLTTLER